MCCHFLAGFQGAAVPWPGVWGRRAPQRSHIYTVAIINQKHKASKCKNHKSACRVRARTVYCGASQEESTLRRSRKMPTKARGAIARAPGAPATIEEFTIDDPGTNEVLVRILASGVCHT